MQIGARVSAELTATVTGPRGTRTYRGPNLVTDTGLNGLVGLNSESNPGAIGSISRLAVGTGNAPPTPQDTHLDNWARAGATDSTYYPASLVVREGWSVHRLREVATFPPDGTPRNYTEVGLFTSTTTTGASARMAQRALFRDELGDPTVVTVGEDEYLTVEWDTYLWRSLEDQVFTLDIDGTPTTVTVRPVESTAAINRTRAWNAGGMEFVGSSLGNAVWPATQDLVDHTTSPPTSGRVTPSGTTSSAALGVGHRRLSFTLPPTEGNVSGGIGVVALGPNTGSTSGSSPLWRSQMKFDPPIPKDVTKEMTLTIELKAEAGEPPEE